MPDFGYSTIGGSTDDPYDNWIWCKATSTPAADGTLSTIQCYCAILAGAPTICMGIYEDVSGYPGALLEENVTGATVGGGFDWVSQAFSAAVVSGRQYWLALRVPNPFSAGTEDVSFAYDSNGGASELYASENFSNAAFPDPAPGGMSPITNERVSIYATYDGGPPAGTHIVSGTGSFSVASPTWLSTTTTDDLSALQIGGANPPNYYHLGMLRWASDNGVMTAYPLTSDTDLVQIPAGMTTVYYTLRAGITVTIVELAAP